ncbi:MAG TPA: TetR/AcrR family transcriptional regulator [Burkholderiaceae bacterium]|nr:TetR/AcrR family transcriptional regulator [Burkholderiaceae bacterium]
MAAASAPVPGKGGARVSVRARLLAAADDLFYEGGTHSVGIDRILERAGVAKASLYDTFGSKDALVQAYLEARDVARRRRVEAAVARHTSPRQKLLGVFDAVGDYMSSPQYRGCAFSRASGESRPVEGVKHACDVARDWLRDLFRALARDAGARRPDTLASQLMLLYDGASVSGLMEGGVEAARIARDAAEVLLDAALPTQRA